jgi:hypothetical protein
MTTNTSTAAPRLHRTREYKRFYFPADNRPIDVVNLRPQHKRLRESMREYGFLPSFPLMVQVVNGKLYVKDGQHRLTFARELGLDVFYVITDQDISIAKINQAQVGWTPKDYAMSFAAQGKHDYQRAIGFCDRYRIPISVGFAMLRGTIVAHNIKAEFETGTYKITNETFASRVAKLYKEIVEISPKVRQQNMLHALWSCCHVETFDETRILQTASKRPDLLQNLGTVENFLQMLEEIYNFGRRTKEPLKFEAEQAMRARSAAKKA